MGLLQSLREWRAERVKQSRAGDVNCRRCGGRWLAVEQHAEQIGTVVPSSNAATAWPPVRAGSSAAYTVYRCEGCGSLRQEAT
jgi:DNA-directed RNA polymerase subunit RPC12/RpoP